MHKKILHGLDGSESAYKALREAIDLSKRYGAELHTISVEEMPRYPGTISEVVEEKVTANAAYGEVIARAREMAKQEGVDLHSHVVVGHEVRTILEFIKQQEVDLLVIGFMGHSALYERVMGGTCQGLVRLAPCSVLVVK
ncbi:MAG: universal stress protein [Thermodesulfobacteriota bacterium]|nr:universal stress protein [Thermodesulfobacteriota bacterium]